MKNIYYVDPATCSGPHPMWAGFVGHSYICLAAGAWHTTVCSKAAVGTPDAGTILARLSLTQCAQLFKPPTAIRRRQNAEDQGEKIGKYNFVLVAL